MWWVFLLDNYQVTVEAPDRIKAEERALVVVQQRTHRRQVTGTLQLVGVRPSRNDKKRKKHK